LLRLRTLGGLSIEREGAPLDNFAAQRKALALLALLAGTANGGMTRDKVLAYLWPESDEERARNALNQLLFTLRRQLDAPALFHGTAELRLNTDVITSDLAEFERALARNALEAASKVYGGPFLEGFHLPSAAEFERWVDETRARLARAYVGALRDLALAAQRAGRPQLAVEWWRRVAAADPVSSQSALALMQALVEAGDTAAAIQHARVHDAYVRQVLDASPDPAVSAFAGRLQRASTRIQLDTDTFTPATAARLSTAAVAAEQTAYNPGRSALARRLRRTTTRTRVLIAALFVLGAVGPWLGARSPEAAPPHTVAVLPFRAVGATADLEYISDGLTEELINALAQVTELQVIARASAFRYKDHPVDFSTITSRLGAEAVVTGSVRKSGTTVRVNARLIRIADGRQLWAGSYQHESRDLIAAQQEIATHIARTLVPSTRAASAAAGVPGSTRDAEAHALYFRALYLLNKRTPEDLWRAIAYFERAIAKDSSYALAYAGIAQSYLLLGSSFGVFPLRDALARAEAASRRALAIDDRVSAAHTALAYAHQLRRQWTSAEHEYRRALALNPSDATAHSWHAFLLMYTGRKDAAVREIELASRLDPASIGIGANLGWAYYFARRYREAIQAFRRVLDLDPGAFAMHNGIGRAYEQLGLTSEAISAYREALRLSGGSAQGRATLAHALATAGQLNEAQAILRELENGANVDPYFIAMACAGLGDKDRAFGYLARAVRERSPLLNQVTVDPLFDPIRSDARFASLLRDLNLHRRGT